MAAAVSASGGTGVNDGNLGAGPLLFSRFAYPPNVLGYCGPDAHRELLERVDAGAADEGLRRLARDFDGAWPYLELIAHEHGLSDPLDVHVVEAYWIGSEFLDLRAAALASSLDDRFRGLTARDRTRLAGVVDEGARPHHNFHVFCVYPWVGLLRTGATDHALHVLDHCRIRIGRVVQIDGPTAVVMSRPLTWDGRGLGLGGARPETVSCAEDGYRLDGQIAVDDLVALHWDWACSRLTLGQARALHRETLGQLAFANHLAVPPPAAVLE